MTRPQFAPRGQHRADALLAAWTRAQPWRADYWRAVDAIRARHDPIPWPRAVYLPLEEAGEVVADAWVAQGRQPTPASVIREACELQVLAAWRLTRGVYRYDPTLAAALRETPVTGELPAEALTRLPEWCVYIETPDETAPARGQAVDLLGYFACLDWVSSTQRDPDDWTSATSHYQLQLGLDLSTAGLSVANVPLVGTLEQAIAANVDQWRANWDTLGTSAPTLGYETAARQHLPALISRVLYLCADDPDYAGERRPRRPQPTRTKQGYRLFPAERLTTWEVGVRIGAAIRRAQEEEDRAERERLASGRARPRPHIRAAHWHSFWRGPRKDPDRRELTVRWLPPLPVNVEDAGDLPTTIHLVE